LQALNYSLAVGLVAANGGLGGSAGALDVCRLLGDESHTSLVSLSGCESDSLFFASV
jgi:hypothetical protein